MIYSKKINMIKLIKSQQELLKELAKGNTIAQIAIKNNCSFNNIKKRTQNLYKKFAVNSRYSLINKALEFKIIKYKDISKKFRKRFFKDKYKNIEKIELPIKNDKLTDKEFIILNLIASGYTKKKILLLLNLYNMHLCNYYFDNICQKLGANNITTAAVIALKLGII